MLFLGIPLGLPMAVSGCPPGSGNPPRRRRRDAFRGQVVPCNGMGDGVESGGRCGRTLPGGGRRSWPYPACGVQVLGFLLLGFVLTACGGGGGATPPQSGEAPLPGIHLPRVATVGPLPVPPVPRWVEGLSTPITEAQLQSYRGYENHPELQAIGAVAAHAQGYRGAGAWIGIADSALNRNAPNLGNVRVLDPEFQFPGFSVYAPGDRQGATLSSYNHSYARNYARVAHGTTVAQLAAGRFDVRNTSDNIIGVAPQAGLAVYGFAGLGFTEGGYRPLDLSNPAAGRIRSLDESVAKIISILSQDAQVDVANLSFGVDGAITHYREGKDYPQDYPQVRAALPRVLRALEQADRSAKTAFVFAAGNAYCPIVGTGCDPTQEADEPELLPGLPLVQASLAGHVIAVVATRQNTQDVQEIASYSNRCGEAAAFCIAAPGKAEVYIPGPNLRYSLSGTSYAAPRVSGALAVLVGQTKTPGGVRQMRIQDLVQRLYETADKSGIYAQRTLYGQGLLNLAAALRPVGSLRMATGSDLDEGLRDFASSRLAAGRAAGDALARAFAGRHLALFDELEFPFPTPLRATLDTAPARRARARSTLLDLEWLAPGARPVASWRVRRFEALIPGPGGAAAWFAPEGRGAGLFADGGAGLGGHLGLLQSPVGVGYTGRTAGLEWRTALFLEAHGSGGKGGGGVTMQLRPATGEGHAAPGPRLTLGWLRRGERLLDTLGTGGFALRDSTTLFAGLAGYSALNKSWWFFYGTTLGYSRARTIAGSALLGGTPLLSLEGEFGLGGRDLLREGDRLGLRLRRPLRVERGDVEFSYALYRTPGRGVVQESFKASLEPSGHQLDLEGVYRLSLTEGVDAGLLLRWSQQPGHVRSAPGEWEALGAMRFAF